MGCVYVRALRLCADSYDLRVVGNLSKSVRAWIRWLIVYTILQYHFMLRC